MGEYHHHSSSSQPVDNESIWWPGSDNDSALCHLGCSFGLLASIASRTQGFSSVCKVGYTRLPKRHACVDTGVLPFLQSPLVPLLLSSTHITVLECERSCTENPHQQHLTCSTLWSLWCALGAPVILLATDCSRVLLGSSAKCSSNIFPLFLTRSFRFFPFIRSTAQPRIALYCLAFFRVMMAWCS